MLTILDRGGTFTDVYAEYGEESFVMKLLSVDPANYPDAPTEGIRRVLEKVTGRSFPKGELIDTSAIESIRMGTTVATNALLERKGDRVAFLVTKGFRDILQIGQQARPSIFDLEVAKLKGLYEQVYEIDERVTIEGFSENHKDEKFDFSADKNLVEGVSGEALRILKDLDMAHVEEILQKIWESGIRSLAIALLHSYIFPKHEAMIAAKAREMGFDVSVSSELQPMIKLVSRGNSTNADAYLSPITMRYVQNFGKGFVGGLEEVGPKLLFMQSDGGLTLWSKFTGLRAILSGPAGGVVGYSRSSYDTKEKMPILGFDMGGTSTDVSRYDGKLEHVFETVTGQVTIQSPQLDINTVAAGGGSILAWKNGLFTVGPESASAHPGPACYRKGGPLTVTDANLFLGRILPEFFPKIFGPNEDEPLNREIVTKKFNELTDVINNDRRNSASREFTPEEVALGFLTVANESMCRPIRALTEGKGLPAFKHHLASFGGAGGQHACAVATNLGISRVIIHNYSSVLSAYGISLADVVSEMQSPESTTLSEDSLPGLETRLDKLAVDAASSLKQQGIPDDHIEVEKYLNLKYNGTESFIMVQQPQNKGETYKSLFTEAHKRQFGFTQDRDILVGDIRVRAIGKSQLSSIQNISEELATLSNTSVKEVKPTAVSRVFYENKGWVDTNAYSLKDLSVGQKVQGPAMIIDNTQTIVVDPNSSATVLSNRLVVDITKEGATDVIDNKKIDPIQLSVFGHRFMSIAEQMGNTLQKTSISTNIKERLDFSCAIFSPDGGLVANAPHIPVHLGSMSSAVAYQKKYWEGKLEPGDVLVANHPAYGGSHLPDITVITPVFSEAGEIIFWAASRGHHSDIGGITAGSMPPFSKHLWEEGAMIQGFKVVKKGVFDEEGLIDLLYHQPSKYPGCAGARSLWDDISDLKAQIAANNKGINLIDALISDFSLEVVQLYMYGIQDNAEKTVRTLLKQMSEKIGSDKLIAEDHIDDGTRINLTININSKTGDAVFDFTGTGPQVYGNLNAPRAITSSAILYVLRSLLSEDIPLNQGCLAPIKLVIPERTLLSPGPEAATVGGNVETSQRITDVVLKAFQVMGASQGTCNNLTFGYSEKSDDGSMKHGFGYYETIAGGAGGGPTWDGQSGVQVHMTNTRSTDPEVLEKRYPCILHQFSIRQGSGGEGLHRGGDGVIREIEFRIPLQLSILSERRAIAPYGMAGGQPGERGQNLLKKWTGDGYNTITLGGKSTLNAEKGDRMVVMTPGGGGYGCKTN